MKLISRQEAIAAGQNRYFTGIPCRNGHVSERFVRKWACVACYTANRARRYASLSAREKERLRAYHRANLAAIRVARGLPVPTRPAPAVCENCGKDPSGRWKQLALDHCHATGKFRGWLCGPCNLSIGQLGDTVQALERATAYLRRAE